MADFPLLVFSDDWGRHPSSCQHLMRHLLPRHSVTWVNTIGTRKPQLDLNTVRRTLGKLGLWFGPASSASWPAGPGPRVLNPWMLPWFGSRISRTINRRLLYRALLPAVRAMPSAPVAVTTIPLVADLVGLLPVRRWVYYCVDDFTEWPGYDGETLRVMEVELVKKVDGLIAVSETLRRRAVAAGRRCALLTHGIDLEFWRQPVPSDAPPFLQGHPGPLYLFWGLIDRRMDLTFLRALACHPGRKGTIVLVGPEADPDPALSRLPGVVRTGPMPYAQLPSIAARASVLIMPYADIPATRAMQPLKLKEYLATGKSVVVRDLPANREWGDCLDLADGPEGFATRVLERAESGLPSFQEAARRRLDDEGWAGKALLFERWLEGDAPFPAEPAGGVS